VSCVNTHSGRDREREGGELSIIKLKFLLLHSFYDWMMRASFISFLLDPFLFKKSYLLILTLDWDKLGGVGKLIQRATILYS
jgi:hypothetical protein